MKLTARDIQVVKDIALSHVLTRDHIIELGYFSSITRANTRLRGLIACGLIQRLPTPFFGQSIYCPGKRAPHVVGEKIAPLIRRRAESPRFLQHAMCVTNVRLALVKRGSTGWRFEQQATASFASKQKWDEVRPDGLSLTPSGLVAVEVDLGHVPTQKLKQKLHSYQTFARTGTCRDHWQAETFSLLFVTNSDTRAHRIRRLVQAFDIDIVVRTFDALDIPTPGSWS